MKERLTTAPVLVVPDGLEGFVVYTNASQSGLGCVLQRETESLHMLHVS